MCLCWCMYVYMMKMQQRCAYLQTTATTATKMCIPTGYWAITYKPQSRCTFTSHRLLSNNHVPPPTFKCLHSADSTSALSLSVSLALSLSRARALSLCVHRASMPIYTLEAALGNSMSYNDASQQVPSKQNHKPLTQKTKPMHRLFTCILILMTHMYPPPHEPKTCIDSSRVSSSLYHTHLSSSL